MGVVTNFAASLSPLRRVECFESNLLLRRLARFSASSRFVSLSSSPPPPPSSSSGRGGEVSLSPSLAPDTSLRCSTPGSLRVDQPGAGDTDFLSRQLDRAQVVSCFKKRNSQPWSPSLASSASPFANPSPPCTPPLSRSPAESFDPLLRFYEEPSYPPASSCSSPRLSPSITRQRVYEEEEGEEEEEEEQEWGQRRRSHRHRHRTSSSSSEFSSRRSLAFFPLLGGPHLLSSSALGNPLKGGGEREKTSSLADSREAFLPLLHSLSSSSRSFVTTRANGATAPFLSSVSGPSSLSSSEADFWALPPSRPLSTQHERGHPTTQMKEHGESEGLRKTETEQEKDREKEKKETSTTEERFAKNKDSDQDEERPKTSTGVPRNDRESGGARDRLSETEESQRKQEDLEQLGASPSSPSSSRSTATASLHPDASLSDGPEKKSGRPELSSPQEKKQEAEEGERRGESPREEGQTSQRAEGRAENREKFFTLLTCAAVFSGLAYEGLRIFQLSRLENKSFQEVLNEEFRRLDEKMSAWNERLHLFLDQKIGTKSADKEPLLPDLSELNAPDLMPTLVLNFDQVLACITYDPVRGYKVRKRPGVDAFLSTLSNFYELVIWSDHPFPYIEDLLRTRLEWPVSFTLHQDNMDRRGITRYRDLARLGRRMDRVLYIDTDGSNLPFAQKENFIRVSPFNGEAEEMLADRTLPELTDLLISAAISAGDVREILRRYGGGADEGVGRRFLSEKLEAGKKADQRRSIGRVFGFSSPGASPAGPASPSPSSKQRWEKM